MCEPFATVVVFHAYVYGLAVSVAASTPSTWKSTFQTPTSSLAVTATVVVPETVDPVLGVETLAVGGVKSTVSEKAADGALMLPTLSLATAEIG